MASHSSILAWRISWIEEPGRYSPWGCTQSDMAEAIKRACSHTRKLLLSPPQPHSLTESLQALGLGLAFRVMLGIILYICCGQDSF